MTDSFTGRRNAGRGHTYFIDGQKVPGVTTIISNGLPKPALVNWAASTAADYAVDLWDVLSGLPVSERRKRISKAHEASRNTAAVRGTKVHALADALSRGERVNVPDELAGHVESCVKFLDDFDVRPVLTEAPVLSRRWKYGGTLDLMGELAGYDGLSLVDWKTSKSGAFGDTAFQLAGYRYAEFTLDPSGNEVPLPQVNQCFVAWLRADGYDLYPYEAGPEVFREFLYIQQTAIAAENSRDYRGDALRPPVRTTA